MPEINRSALVRFSASQMYALVNDVAAYPQFLPGCVGSEVHQADEQSMLASVSVRKAGIAQSFTTENQLEPGSRILMQLKEGPFRQLQGQWQFTPLREDACKVELTLQFEFANALVEKAFGKVFNELAQSMVQSFSVRAKEVYGG
ncbi:SRPBCC family protein [Ferrimonas marina]|uniref:Ribosome association toxin PasT (RatA) of the RatAB toxin-antitoxin module n=1 Tax=Ferrimonas marina TaxID=299255 RepID=A0A1M5VEG6_9GAMM|nr:SRPBCC family protein [Ferrimonas marina]SHH73323.1 Ribosome association toxin PasT (RatA) of the RatAB toxin-antitoxin module [Ferrimonas marina]